MNEETGEISGAIDAGTIREGSQILSPEEVKRRHDYWEREQQRKQREKWRTNGQKYVFASVEHDYSILEPATLARLFYLSTYTGYERAKLCLTQKTPMRLQDLQDVLKLSARETINFLGAVEGKYVFKGEDDSLSIHPSLFVRGKLPVGDRYQRFFIEATRELYKKSTPRSHKHLGYVFQMLQYVNVEYNVLCSNPLETELDCIQFMSLDEFCLRIGYAVEHRSRLARCYGRITFAVGDHEERFCSFVTNGTDLSTARIFVNPNVVYRGNRWDEVKILGKFCQD